MWRYVRSMLGAADLADDVTQEVWAAALKGLPGLRQPERFAPWLFTIARRSVVDHLGDKYAQPDPPDGGHVDGEVDAVLDRAQVAEGLAELPAREREVLMLFYLQDMTLEDCAQILEIPTGTVKSRLFRARRLLRDRLVEKGYTS
jgi:RNA polymerase sigma-70 factor (ECF subfamily)